MTVTPPSSTTSSGSTQDLTALGRTSLAQNFDMFLSLLTTQMKNQDPLSPLDSNQFTAQLVQMTGVEQQLATNDLLKQVVANTGGSLSSAVDLIGKNVRASTDQAGLVSGQAQWGYTLPTGTASAKLEVLDASGRTVHAETVSDLSAGDHAFAWDGKDMTGAILPDGTYTLKVTAADATGANLSVTPWAQGVVAGLEQSDNGVLLTLNGLKVPASQLLSVQPLS